MATNQEEFRGSGRIQTELVVVHGIDGTLRRGILELDTIGRQPIPQAPLPDVLHIRCDNQAESSLVRVSEMKAIFFVKRHEGVLDHDEVKFFSDIEVTDLWIRIRFADGEILEGRTQNNAGLLFDSGVWLRPFDSTGNNVLVYVPKSSIVEFHVMGVAVRRPQKAASEGALATAAVGASVV